MTTSYPVSRVIDWIIAANLSDRELNQLVQSSVIRIEKIAVARRLFRLAVVLPILNALACILFVLITHYARLGDVLCAIILGPLIVSPLCAIVGAMIVASMSDNPNSRY